MAATLKVQKTKCEQCPLRKMAQFREFTADELAFVKTFKSGELHVEKGAAILMEGSASPHLYTVLRGWGFRYKILEDGRRQILNYILPGDLVGLQGSLLGDMQHSVEALSPVSLCVFEREKMKSLYAGHPTLGYDLTWIASREERMLDENLLCVGRRTAMERLAYLISILYKRANQVGMTHGAVTIIPLTQYHVADTLGLSLVHTNKTLRRLVKLSLLNWLDRGFEVLDEQGLRKIAAWQVVTEKNRPFI